MSIDKGNLPKVMNTYIVPRHPRTFSNRDSTAHVVVHVLEIRDARVVVVLAREQRLGEIGRVSVRQRVVVSVPAPETYVKAANASPMVIYNHDL